MDFDQELNERRELFARSTKKSNTNKKTDLKEEDYHLQEQRNDEKIKYLNQKVNTLKDVSLEIERELKDHNALLNDFQNGVEDSRNFVSVAIGKMEYLIATASGRHMCYLICFVFVILWLIYFIWKTKRR
ncbi:golgi snare bet1-related [Anaeramoeba ignava]|uniref:Golgi snare bet1-related n=1 Tax=Anaeramoeba ignava TaxID=1746090 RepID=A0A9Q0LFL3_ANAIG|nr:golgi snare bet1-related [Anaeramoeba ignava]